MKVTALVMSLRPYTREWPGLEVKVLANHVFRTPADHCKAWNCAIALVRTEHFFFLDDDDDLPANYMEVIEACLATGADLSYTDELQRTVNDDSDKDYAGDLLPFVETVKRPGEYSQEKHLLNPTLIHHLALMKTRAAYHALKQLPTGNYWPEMLTYWTMASAQTPAYVPMVGYEWNKSDKGLHTRAQTALAVQRSALWCVRNP